MIMDEQNMVLVFSSDIDSIVEHNSSFDKGVLRICYTGKNRNGSFISKNTFELCMPSIYNCPIVCRYDREEDEIGEHDVELVHDEDGSLRIVNITQPVGVVPSGARYWWETLDDDSGQHEYLCVEVLLWKRQEAYKKIRENGVTDQSMEISVKEGRMVDGIYVIDRFEFLAFCLLGTAEPCYESAALEVFSRNKLNDQLAEMMQDFKNTFSVIQSENRIDIDLNTTLEGGNAALDEKNALIEEFNIDISTLDFNIEDLTVEELREKFQAMSTPANDNNDAANDDAKRFALAGQLRESLIDALRAEREHTEFGEMDRYWYIDHDTELNEVYCQDVRDWNLYGMPYSMNGDNVVIDFEAKKRKKFAIVDFDEGEPIAMFNKLFELIEQKHKETCSAAESWENKFNDVSAEMEKFSNELVELREYKAKIEADILIAKRNEVFSMFEDLNEIEAFIELKNNCENYSVADLEEKCYAIKGKYGIASKFSMSKKDDEQNPTRLPAQGVYNVPGNNSRPYGGIFERFGIIAED